MLFWNTTLDRLHFFSFTFALISIVYLIHLVAVLTWVYVVFCALYIPCIINLKLNNQSKIIMTSSKCSSAINKEGCSRATQWHTVLTSSLRSEIKSSEDGDIDVFIFKLPCSMLEFRVCLCLCSYTLQIRSRHSLHFSNCLSSLSPSQSLSVHFPAGETSVITRPGMDIVAVRNADSDRRSLQIRPFNGCLLTVWTLCGAWWKMSFTVTILTNGGETLLWRACVSLCVCIVKVWILTVYVRRL